MERAIVTISIENLKDKFELEIPVDITVKEICSALNKALHLEEKGIEISGYYIKTKNPTCFLKGKDVLQNFNISHGSEIILI
ncbi:hypothetical protein CM240_1144 [Clostridium bornimense]|uniref:YukD n=1 Tax=Clostridium bornimense TaxID=1216932 RepID=W6RVF1_9CLOT|nr:EsaB/YukD family protein [Clostridium bornimense]CDM68308.1 hypothetical protein CM240_1144 [Clostridium bornimense]